MDRLEQKQLKASQRRKRTRINMAGSAEHPRLSVNVSNLHISAQLIDDQNGKTLLYVSTIGQEQTGTMTKKATWVGQEIAKKAAKTKINKVVFDRGARKYHGRVKSLAEAARTGGLEF